jgi:hypothetical protein
VVNVRPLALAAALLAACASSGASAPRVAAAPAAAATSDPIPLETGFAALRARFDADAARARLLVLASPT